MTATRKCSPPHCNECDAVAEYVVGYTDGSSKSGVCRRHLARVVRLVVDEEGFVAQVSQASDSEDLSL